MIDHSRSDLLVFTLFCEASGEAASCGHPEARAGPPSRAAQSPGHPIACQQGKQQESWAELWSVFQFVSRLSIM